MKLIIETDQETIEDCKRLFVEGVSNNAEYAIANGTPITDNMIDELCRLRSDLRTGLHVGCTLRTQTQMNKYVRVLDTIINLKIGPFSIPTKKVR